MDTQQNKPFKIIKGLPIPPKPMFAGRPYQYADIDTHLAKLKIGEAMDMPVTLSRQTLSYILSRYQKKVDPDKAFTYRTISQNGLSTLRVWRAK